MLMVQISQPVAMGPFGNFACVAEVGTSPSITDKENSCTKPPPKSPLMKGEQISSTSCHSASQRLAATSNDPAPEVTQGPPQWLEGLFTSDLFNPCPSHANQRKNECNFYCLACTPACRRGMCKYCITDHTACGRQVFQIRKYMYQTCVHVEDLAHLYDTSGVQAYCINGKRAVLIHPKVMAPGQQCPVFDNTCRGCEKPLRSDCQYCSLKCKVDVQYGRAPRTPEVTALDVQQPRAPMTVADRAPSSAVSDGSARSSSSQWTCLGRGKKRKCEHPLRSHMG